MKKWLEVQGLGCDTWRHSELDLAKAYYRRSNILVSNSWEMNCQCNSFLSWNELNESYEYMKIDELENSWKAILELKVMFGFRFSNPKPKTKQILEHLCSLFSTDNQKRITEVLKRTKGVKSWQPRICLIQKRGQLSHVWGHQVILVCLVGQKQGSTGVQHTTYR